MYNNFFKRFFDVLGGLILLPILVIFTIVIGLIIKLEDRGTIFYIARRLGKNGKVFSMYKFRSMKMNAPDIRNEDNSTFNSDNDVRLTRIGKLLRKTSFDEIPQVINVLKGDMSFIGPRPDLPEALMKYSEDTKTKLNVRPGISGYNQAYYRNSVKAEEKFKNDVYYVNNISLLMDLKILLKTIDGIIRKKNIFTNTKSQNQNYLKRGNYE